MGARSRSWAAVDMEGVGSEEEGGCDRFVKSLIVKWGNRAGIDEDLGLEKKLYVIHAESVSKKNHQLYIGERLAAQGRLSWD